MINHTGGHGCEKCADRERTTVGLLLALCDGDTTRAFELVEPYLDGPTEAWGFIHRLGHIALDSIEAWVKAGDADANIEDVRSYLEDAAGILARGSET